MNREKVEFLKQRILELTNLDEYMHGAGEKRTQMAARMLRKTVAIFWELYRESEAELHDTYKEICSLNEDEQIAIWGKKRELMEREEMEERLIEGFQYQYTQSDALQEFLRVIDELENK